MQAAEIQDVLTVQGILRDFTGDVNQDGISEAETIAALIDWAEHRDHVHTSIDPIEPVPAPTVEAPKPKRGKATESKDSDTFEPTPDPSSDEPDF